MGDPTSWQVRWGTKPHTRIYRLHALVSAATTVCIRTEVSQLPGELKLVRGGRGTSLATIILSLFLVLELVLEYYCDPGLSRSSTAHS